MRPLTPLNKWRLPGWKIPRPIWLRHRRSPSPDRKRNKIGQVRVRRFDESVRVQDRQLERGLSPRPRKQPPHPAAMLCLPALRSGRGCKWGVGWIVRLWETIYSEHSKIHTGHTESWIGLAQEALFLSSRRVPLRPRSANRCKSSPNTTGRGTHHHTQPAHILSQVIASLIKWRR